MRTTKEIREVEERLYPMLRGDNAEAVIYPWDRKYGALLVGGQGTGKSSALLTFYENDVEDPETAPIVIDPKPQSTGSVGRFRPVRKEE